MNFIILENKGVIEVRLEDILIFVSTDMEEVENFIKWKLEMGEKKGLCTSC
jgi:hypothetical protein